MLEVMMVVLDMEVDKVERPDRQIYNWYKWLHLVAKF